MKLRQTVQCGAGGTIATFPAGPAGLYLIRGLHVRRASGVTAATNYCFLAGDYATSTERCLQFTYQPASAVFNLPGATIVSIPCWSEAGSLYIYFPPGLSGDSLVATLFVEYIGNVRSL